MTNRSMVKPGSDQRPDAQPLPAMPSPEGATTATTRIEPEDSPQVSEQGQRKPSGGGTTQKRMPR